MLATYGGIDGHVVKTPNDFSSAFDSVVETNRGRGLQDDVRSPPADTKNLQLLSRASRSPHAVTAGPSTKPPTSR